VQAGPTSPSVSDHAATECALCAAHAKATTARRAPVRRHSEILPWLLAIVVSGPYALIVEGAERWLSFGLCLGLVAGAYIVWRSRVANERAAARSLAAHIHDLNADADERVKMVIRQFEWAVNDVANLREALKSAHEAHARSESAASRARRYAHRLERQLYEARMKIGEQSHTVNNAETQPDVEPNEPQNEPDDEPLLVPLVWRVFEEDGLQWLRLESAGIVPARVRVLNAAQSVIAISAGSIEPTQRKQVSIVLRVPDEVRLALEHHADQARHFRFEALVDEAWCPVAMRDARSSNRVRVKDKRGRVWRPEDQDSALIA